MDKIPAVNSKVRFWGRLDKNAVAETEFEGFIMGYGTVMGGLWKNEPEAVCLVEIPEQAAIIAVSHKGMELLEAPVIF